MYYKRYGKQDFKVSAIGMGCMRFDQELVDAGRLEECAEVVLYAHERGINYFDTAPEYCDDNSEQIVGIALSQLPRNSFYVSSKTNFTTVDDPPTEAGFFRRLETTLTRLKVDYLDVYHLWCMLTPQRYERECPVMYPWFEKAKAQGLIKHIAVSSHMRGSEIEDTIVKDGGFEAMLIGYNVINHRLRQSGISAAYDMGMAIAVMNPLCGGLIPRNAERFAYLAEGTELTPSQAALRYVASHKEITITLNGFTTKQHVDDAVKAVEGLSEYPVAVLNEKFTGESLGDLCTGCGYCEHCPMDIPIPRFMDVYNKRMLGLSEHDALDDQWDLNVADAAKCIACGNCESLCTQHLNIIERLKAVSAYKD